MSVATQLVNGRAASEPRSSLCCNPLSTHQQIALGLDKQDRKMTGPAALLKVNFSKLSLKMSVGAKNSLVIGSAVEYVL